MGRTSSGASLRGGKELSRDWTKSWFAYREIGSDWRLVGGAKGAGKQTTRRSIGMDWYVG